MNCHEDEAFLLKTMTERKNDDAGEGPRQRSVLSLPSN